MKTSRTAGASRKANRALPCTRSTLRPLQILRRESAGHSSGVRWVRAADLLAEVAGGAAGPGLDLHAELARRARHFPATVLPAVAQRARSIGERRLPAPIRQSDLPTRGI